MERETEELKTLIDDISTELNDVLHLLHRNRSGTDGLSPVSSSPTEHNLFARVTELLARGKHFSSLGKHALALKFYLACLSCIEPRTPEQISVLTSCLRNISESHYALGNFDEAVRFLNAERHFYESALANEPFQESPNAPTVEFRIQRSLRLSEMFARETAEASAEMSVEYALKAFLLSFRQRGLESAKTRELFDRFTGLQQRVCSPSHAEKLCKYQALYDKLDESGSAEDDAPPSLQGVRNSVLLDGKPSSHLLQRRAARSNAADLRRRRSSNSTLGVEGSNDVSEDAASVSVDGDGDGGDIDESEDGSDTEEAAACSPDPQSPRLKAVLVLALFVALPIFTTLALASCIIYFYYEVRDLSEVYVMLRSVKVVSLERLLHQFFFVNLDSVRSEWFISVVFVPLLKHICKTLSIFSNNG
eukprot:Rmarinus@m.16876